MAMTCSDAIRERRSIRCYKPEKIPLEDIYEIMEAARRAPTDAALHLWTAVWVRDPQAKKKLADAIGQRHIEEASDFFIYIADLYRLERLLAYRGDSLGDVDLALLVFAAIDAGIAAENMALVAVEKGYGTCFIGGVQNAVRQVIQQLRLPRHTYPLFGLTIGIPAEDPPPRPRLPLHMLFHSEQYHDYTLLDLYKAYQEMAPITRRGDYYRLLRRYVARGGYFEERNREMPEVLEKMGFRLNLKH